MVSAPPKPQPRTYCNAAAWSIRTAMEFIAHGLHFDRGMCHLHGAPTCTTRRPY